MPAGTTRQDADLHIAAQIQVLQVLQLASTQELHSIRGQVVVRDVKELQLAAPLQLCRHAISKLQCDKVQKLNWSGAYFSKA
jgi:hypothetical protein